MDFISVRFFFETMDVAVEALIVVLEDARETDKDYSFGSLSAQQIMASGLLLIGDAQHVVNKIQELPGVYMTVD